MIRATNRRGVAVTCLLAVAVAGCKDPAPTAADADQVAVDGCAGSNLASKAVLYFGPSNQIGPGSVWQRMGDLGGYQPLYRLQDLGIDAGVIQQGAPFSCDLTRARGWKADAALSVLSGASTVSADAKADFSRATSVTVSTSGAAWDDLLMGPYGARLRAIPDAAVRADVTGPKRLSLRRALRVAQYKVTLTFDSSVGPSLQAKYGGASLPSSVVGNAGANFSVNWTGSDKLELTASNVYVAGEFAELKDGDWQASRGQDDLGETWIKPMPAR
jgi:hypothetical protein